jgi:transcriptional regulator GlxA family with amidase domain
VARTAGDRTTWEEAAEFRASYPSFQLEDELFSKEGRDVMVECTYQRRRRSSG